MENSLFKQHGLGTIVKAVCDEIRELYLWDELPWIVGYSGGKDSSAVLQLVWLAVAKLPPEQRTKPIHVISTDTLVEQPVVAAWVDASHAKMRTAAAEQQMPITPHKLTPEVKDSFWVNLIGKGYPAPRKKFRWCTERMKINPSNRFIREVVRESGEALLLLGTRKAESQRRAATMAEHDKKKFRDRLTPNASLPNSMVYTPIEDWTNDDVWLFLMQVKNPWGYTNKSLLGMYQGASADGECPLVVDTTTPSCGSSRFGCWVCTLVDQDRSMEAMIKNDDEKLWMTPLLEFRNEIGDFSNEATRRDYRRMGGNVFLGERKSDGGRYLVRGPYRPKWRRYYLRRLLEVQQQIREIGPPEVAGIELISLAELQEIARIWEYEKGEMFEPVGQIFEDVVGGPFPSVSADDRFFGDEDFQILKDVAGEDDSDFVQMLVQMLSVERKYRSMSRRAGVFEDLTACLKSAQFRDEEEAVAIRLEEEERRRKAEGRVPGQVNATPQRLLFEDDEVDSSDELQVHA